MYADTGEYVQVRRGGAIAGGFRPDALVLSSLVSTTTEVFVYEATCGRGWQLNVFDEYDVISATSGARILVTDVHTVGGGCDAAAATVNW